MKRFLAFFLSILLLCGYTVHAEEIQEPEKLYAKAAVLMDADSGRVLYEKNGFEVMAMASTTKIMTCIICLEEGNLEDVVITSELAANQPKVHLGMKKGEKFILKDLLYSLMLESHNDSAVAIAEHVAGSVEQFADKMNDKAKELGCKDTHFITPNGLDEVDEIGIHGTTAKDLATIMSYCIKKSEKKEKFLKITQTKEYNFSNVDNNRNFHCTNHNSFLNMMDGAISGKTGFTGKAGYCYVGAVERDGRCFVVALLACGWPNNKNYKWKDTKTLMEYGVNHYTYQNVIEDIKLPKVTVMDGIPDSENLFDEGKVHLEVYMDEDESLEMLLRKDEKVDVKVNYEEVLRAPIQEKEQVGEVNYFLNGEPVKSYPIVVSESVDKKDITWFFEKISKLYFCMQ